MALRVEKLLIPVLGRKNSEFIIIVLFLKPDISTEEWTSLYLLCNNKGNFWLLLQKFSEIK